MSLFGRRTAMGPLPRIAGIEQLAAARGGRPAGEHPFDADLDRVIHRVSRVMYDAPPVEPSSGAVTTGPAPTFYADAHRFDVDGRAVIVANAWTPVRGTFSTLAHQRHGTAICAVEIPTVLAIAAIEPTRFRRPAVPLRPVATGDPAFDGMFRVAGSPDDSGRVLTPEVRRRMMARDDWAFTADKYLLCCIGLGEFGTAQDVVDRVDEVLGIVAAIPANAMPAAVDHSVDDLVARFGRVGSLEDGMAVLASLSDEDRRRLARSTSPLAGLADVRTPQEAVARLTAMDPGRRAQLLAMFMRVEDERRGRF